MCLLQEPFLVVLYVKTRKFVAIANSRDSMASINRVKCAFSKRFGEILDHCAHVAAGKLFYGSIVIAMKAVCSQSKLPPSFPPKNFMTELRQCLTRSVITPLDLFLSDRFVCPAYMLISPENELELLTKSTCVAATMMPFLYEPSFNCNRLSMPDAELVDGHIYVKPAAAFRVFPILEYLNNFPGLEMRPHSHIKGQFGVFAVVGFKKGSLVTTYAGERNHVQVFQNRLKQLDCDQRSAIDSYLLELSPKFCLSGHCNYGFGPKMNHSRTCANVRPVHHNNDNFNTKGVHFVALKDISPDEELLWNYYDGCVSSTDAIDLPSFHNCCCCYSCGLIGAS